MIKVLQAGRFFAAMAVVVHHATTSVSVFVGPVPLSNLLTFGYLGVDFFFVLSGFIIHYTMSVSARPAGRFAYDRLIRIMIPYLPIGVLLAMAYSFFPSLSAGNRSWGWLSSITLIPTEHPPALSVAWTLQHELVFYFLYAFLFFSGRILPGLILWGGAILVANILSLHFFPLLKVFLSPINVEFVAGICVAEIYQSNRKIPIIGSLILSVAFVVAFWQTGADRGNSWLIGFSIAALLPWLCQAERSGKISVPRWLVFGGGASYAIYLIHNPLLSLISRIFGRFGFEAVVSLLLACVVCFIAGALYYKLWERPVMRALKP